MQKRRRYKAKARRAERLMWSRVSQAFEKVWGQPALKTVYELLEAERQLATDQRRAEIEYLIAALPLIPINSSPYIDTSTRRDS